MNEQNQKELTPLQQAMLELVERQKQALKKCCDVCWGSLERVNILTLKCPACDKKFEVNDLIKEEED